VLPCEFRHFCSFPLYFFLQYLGGEVDLSTLVQLVSERVTNPPTERPEDLREIFRLYDKDGRGLISVTEMRHLLTSVGEKLTDDEAEELLRMSGCVTNGMVAYDSEYLSQMVETPVCYFELITFH
jgi:Ca2+-binding EF-hand superfamily protein